VALLPAASARAGATSRSAVLIVDANTGRVLHASAADEPRHPASLAKMMTLYLAFELIEQGRLSYQSRIKISANAAETEPTKLGLEEGEEIALIDAMKAVITKSANDMAVAIAEHISGSEEKFARLMTQRARQIGMASTTFRNASGLPDDEQITTARDMVTLALRLIDDYPRHYALFATKSFTYKDETFRNHNTLLSSFEGTDGIKTGYTRASGFNLVSSVRRGRKHVVGAIFGGESAATRNAAMRTFLSMGLVKASAERTRRPAPALVAQARPAPPIGPVPAPRRVERPASQPAVTTVPAPADQAAAAAYEALPASGALRIAPAIEVARVRPVLVSPRQADPAAADEPRTGSSNIEEVLARAELASERPADPLPTWATASAGSLRSSGSAASADRPALFADPASGLGAAPSTLDRQAANLERNEPAIAPAAAAAPAWPAPTVSPLQVPVPVRAARPSGAAAASTAASGAFHIQIGAYQSQAEAERRLASARELAPGLLANRAPVTTQVRQGDKLYFRARYAGFEAPAAASACSALKRLKIDCLVMKAE
jgi:D-alanyl-D-alanine carboxypeptidase